MTSHTHVDDFTEGVRVPGDGVHTVRLHVRREEHRGLWAWCIRNCARDRVHQRQGSERVSHVQPNAVSRGNPQRRINTCYIPLITHSYRPVLIVISQPPMMKRARSSNRWNPASGYGTCGVLSRCCNSCPLHTVSCAARCPSPQWPSELITGWSGK